MALVTTKEMFKKAYEGGYAIGAFNINNMEIIQAIAEAAGEAKSPVILPAQESMQSRNTSLLLLRLLSLTAVSTLLSTLTTAQILKSARRALTVALLRL